MALRYRMLHTDALLSKLMNNKGLLMNYSDFFDGSEYLEAFNEALMKG